MSDFAGRLVLSCLLVAGVAGRVAAQCATVWLPGEGPPGLDQVVLSSTMWDPDGAGPLPAQLVVGGGFSIAGDSIANRIAAWNPATRAWSALGSGVGNSQGARVLAVTSLPNGELIAGGNFSIAGGVAVGNIARWNGSSWSALGAGTSGVVRALTTLPNGDLIAGGDFTVASGGPADHIARWDGIAWSALGSGMNGAVTALATTATGDLLAAGSFTNAGGTVAPRVARWNGSTWSALGAGPSSGRNSVPQPHALVALPNGDIVVGGAFAGFMLPLGHCVQRWDGTSWSPVGPPTGPLSSVYALLALPNGDLLAGGLFGNFGGAPTPFVARWNGTSWSSVGGGTNGPVQTLTSLPNGDPIAGGSFTLAGAAPGTPTNYVARWNGATWSALSPGWNGSPRTVAALPNGDFVVGGDFTSFDGVALHHIAKRSGAAWLPMGTGMNGPVTCSVSLPNGDLVAGGTFTTAGGAAASFVARWNGVAWTPLGSGLTNAPRALAALPNGDVVAGGDFPLGPTQRRVMRWDGATWSTLGPGTQPFGEVLALATLPNGNLVAGGNFVTLIGGGSVNRVARWNGVAWTPMGAGLPALVQSLATTANGDILAGTNAVSRWDGSTWTQFGTGTGTNGSITALAELPNGDVVAGGFFETAGGTPVRSIARWNGVAWAAIDAGFENLNGSIAQVQGLARLASDDLVAVGSFTLAGGDVANGVARLTTTCPATAVASGLACPSSGGSNSLTAAALPWVASTFRARATGLPNVALVFAATSVTPIPQGAAPLAALFAQAPAGCDLLVVPDILQDYVTTTGSLVTSLALPNTPLLAGLPFFHQVVPFELDPAGNIVQITATNALSLTLGSF